MSKIKSISDALARSENRGSANVERYEMDPELLAMLEGQGNSIIPVGGNLTIGNFTFSKTGVSIPVSTTPEEWKGLLNVLGKFDTAMQWYLGDAIAFGEMQWGKTYKELAALTRYKEKTLREWAFVCRNLSIRMDKLSFGHHQAVASKSPSEQQYWLEKADEGTDGKPWSVHRLRKEMGQTKSITRPAHIKAFQAVKRFDDSPTDAKTAKAVLSRIEEVRRWLFKVEQDAKKVING